MNNEIWVLGATGRTGRLVAARLIAAGHEVALVGRSHDRLTALAAEMARKGGAHAPRIIAGTLDATLAELVERRPAVVVNTVGPFTATAAKVALACLPGTHYVDVANEFPALEAVLALHEQAVAAGRTLVTAAGFGVLGTESVLLRVLDGQDQIPSRVRVDAMPSVAGEPGKVGTALASSILGGIGSGGGSIDGGRMTKGPVGADAITLTTPAGEKIVTGSVPTGDLLTAWRASKAPKVVSGSAMVPTGSAFRMLQPALIALFKIPAVTRFAIGRLAEVTMKAKERPRENSWTHARAEWPSGAVREGWLRTGDAMDFTVAATAEVAMRLARGEGTPGAYTPGALFGPDLAVVAGAEFVIEETAHTS